VPREFRELVFRMKLGDRDGFAKAVLIAFYLSHQHPRGRGLGVTSVEALKEIWAGTGGVCSDYAQVLLGLCVAAGIPAREWGVSYDLFRTGMGHSFNEVYSRFYQKWVFIDSYRSFYLTDRESGVPLSVPEIVRLPPAALLNHAEVHMVDDTHLQSKGRPPSDFFSKPANIYFLLSGNNVFRQDKVLRFAGIAPAPVLHLWLLATSNYYHYCLFTDYPRGAQVIETYAALKRKFRMRIEPALVPQVSAS
jgi:hypothetical protein